MYSLADNFGVTGRTLNDRFSTVSGPRGQTGPMNDNRYTAGGLPVPQQQQQGRRTTLNDRFSLV